MIISITLDTNVIIEKKPERIWLTKLRRSAGESFCYMEGKILEEEFSKSREPERSRKVN